MATWDFASVIEYEKDGNSHNFSNGGVFIDQSGTLDDGETFPTLGYDSFELGDTFTFTTPASGASTIPLNTSVTLNFVGTYENGGKTYVVASWAGNTNFGFVFSYDDAATTTADLPNTISVNDIDDSDFSPCFLAGTMVATPEGEIAVERLMIGDRVVTAGGALARVKWVGRKTILPLFRPAERLMPVRFAAGSLGGGLPHADLTVTADHAMLVEGVLCNAGALVNGRSIVRVPLAEMGGQFTVYHIETEAHEIILANGAPAETFIDNVSRRVFDNYTEFEAMYGDVPEMQELPLPRALSARQVPAAIHRRLGETGAAVRLGTAIRA
ncbi:Hint domain-containing protein [Seohaeicola saemankumensis]|nr:Hint domain-containing protein [Seohaeicola saemankumensis]MCA0870136.1 Hint domain-containing protein [Seohaeicola saemankumensis]